MIIQQTSLIFSLLVLSTTSLTYTSSFEKECMPGISLSELHEKYNAQSKLFKDTDTGKKIHIRQEQFREKIVSHSIAFSKCRCYKSSTTGFCALLNGCSEKDCKEAEVLQEEMGMAQQRFHYALFRAKESDPEFAELTKCIFEREYNDLSVSKEEII